jgi:RNA polymerase sigma-70 factor (ECF subfamily)
MAEATEFERLVLEQLDSFWGYALGLTGREDRAEDVLQDALTRGFERFELFDRSLSFKAWMFTIIRHTHVDHLRKAGARRFINRGSELLDEGIPAAPASPLYAIPLDPEALLVHRESVERLQEAIQQLPAEMREVVELRDIEGLSYREIAVVVKRPIGTVMSRLYRGRNLLRSSLVEAKPGEKRAESGLGL